MHLHPKRHGLRGLAHRLLLSLAACAALMTVEAFAQTSSGGRPPVLSPDLVDKFKSGTPKLQVPSGTPKLDMRKCPYVDLAIERLDLTKHGEVPNGFTISLTAHVRSKGAHEPLGKDSFILEFYAGSVSKGKYLVDTEKMQARVMTISTPRFSVNAGPQGTLTAPVSARITRGPRARPTDQDCNAGNNAATISKDEVTRILLTR
jgi:hypothetical protein